MHDHIIRSPDQCNTVVVVGSIVNMHVSYTTAAAASIHDYATILASACCAEGATLFARRQATARQPSRPTGQCTSRRS